MAQLEGGKVYTVPVGITDFFTDTQSDNHTSEEYFIWIANKISETLGITLNYHIIDGESDNKNCFFTLPYINEPTNNKLQLYMETSSASQSVASKDLRPYLSFSNGDNYYIDNRSYSFNSLPLVIDYPPYASIKVKNNGWRNMDANNPGGDALRRFPATFVLDARFLDTNGFYTFTIIPAVSDNLFNSKIENIVFPPRIFIIDMIDTLTNEHYDGALILNNRLSQSSYEHNYVFKNNAPYELNEPSASAIGIGEDKKYTLQGFRPQIFVTDFNRTTNYEEDANNIISLSMIKVQFGRLKSYNNIYLLLCNTISSLSNLCSINHIFNEHISWSKDALKIKNKKYNLSCTCDTVLGGTLHNGRENAQWAVAIEEEYEEPKIKLVPWSTGTNKEITAMIKGYYNNKITLDDIKSVWHIGDTRKVSLKAMSATYVSENHRSQNVEMQILDFNHDILTTPINGKTKALITIDQKDCLMDKINYDNVNNGHPEIRANRPEDGYINPTEDNTTRWKNCARRKWCNEVYYNSLPKYLRELNKEVKKVSDNSYTEDRIFLLSEYEVTGLKKCSAYIEGTQYPIYKTVKNRIKHPRFSYNDNNSYCDIWWLRSPYKSGTVYWCEIRELMDCDMHLTTRKYGLAPAMCL